MCDATGDAMHAAVWYINFLTQIFTMKNITALIFLFTPFFVFAQKHKQKDTIPVHLLDTITINTVIKNAGPTYLQNVTSMNVFAGKKTNMLVPDAGKINVAQNKSRQLFAQIPGMHFWEMDGAGTQINVGTRGTDAHRSIEMNMRQNGYNTNSDMFGYPENHYTIPMQAIDEIQLLRGSAALQFGPQFGGMMNIIIKTGDSTKPFAIESEQTGGSNNFFNSYNAIGGTKGKLKYYAYYDYRHGDGWRNNASFNYHALYANVEYNFNNKGNIALQFSRMDYVQQIAGGLTDAQFAADAKQSFRERNFFQPVINIPAIIFAYKFSENTKVQITSHALFGERNSVQFINTPNIPDTFNVQLGTYNPRQVDRDYYKAFTTEIRFLHNYTTGNIKNTLAAGARFFTEQTKRKQKGIGTTGSDFNLNLTAPYGINLTFNTINYALFAENIFYATKKLSITPGIRYEVIQSKLNGIINNGTYTTAYKSNRNFPLFGLGLQYQNTTHTQLYANISQAYRPYLYANITPADRVDKIDPSLKDSKGYDIDLGYRGHYSDLLKFDVNLFYLFYGNHIGLVSQTNADNTTYLLTTNIGNSVAKGAEVYAEISLLQLFKTSRKTDIRIFTSLAYTHARYTSGTINKSGINTSVAGNYIENSPDWMNTSGITFQTKKLTASLQYTYNSKSFNDAFNTTYSANGVVGILPAYHVWDVSCNWQFAKKYHASAGINNLTNQKYFNRRITMYPGPGILPADGRTFYIGLGIKL